MVIAITLEDIRKIPISRLRANYSHLCDKFMIPLRW